MFSASKSEIFKKSFGNRTVELPPTKGELSAMPMTSSLSISALNNLNNSSQLYHKSSQANVEPRSRAGQNIIKDLFNINQEQILQQNLHAPREEPEPVREQPVAEPPAEPARPARERVQVEPLVMLGEKQVRNESEKELLNELEFVELIKSTRQDESEL